MNTQTAIETGWAATDEMASIATSIRSPATKAEAILNDLGYGDMTVPMAKFNDDDFYLINPMTREIKAQFGSKQRFIAERAAVNGLQAVRGMRAKHMDLWRMRAN